MGKVLMIGAAIVAVAAAQNASAATTVLDCGSGTTQSCNIVFDGISGTFGNPNVVRSPFVDRYAFDLGAGLLSLTLSTTYTGAANGTQDIDFSLVRLNAPGQGGFTQVPLVPTTDEFYQIRDLSVTAGQYILRLEGSGAANLNASYSGTLNFSPTAAVPEPATWAMMLLGFGGIGFAMRRRKSKVTTQVAFAA